MSHSFEMQGIWTMTKTAKTTKTMMAVWDEERAKMRRKKETTSSSSSLSTTMTTTSTKGRRKGMIGVRLLLLGGDARKEEGKEKATMTMMTRIAKHEKRRGVDSATQLLLQQVPGRTAEVIQEWQKWERDQQHWRQCNAMLRTKPTKCDRRLKRGWWWWRLADGIEGDTQLPWWLYFLGYVIRNEV